MALTSETQASPKGVDCIEHESFDTLNEEDLEDGEIFEDEESAPPKPHPVAPVPTVPQPKPEPVQEVPQVVQEKPAELLRNHRGFENNGKLLPKEQRVPFFKGKRKINEAEEEERWKRDGKRNRRGLEYDRDGELVRMRHDTEPGDDDEEMMFIRGASPHRQNEEKDKWDRDGGEDDERSDMPRRQMRNFRGRGGVSRRGERARGRGRGRGALRGGKRKRDDEMCVYFLQGKCHRGSECPFLHEVLPPRKMELCKFYMKDCCAKKDKCLYMHSEFPCKYYHTGLKCYANKKCKFSHSPLTDITRNVLAKHLDTAPQDILGDFCRRDRDQRDRGDLRDMRGPPRDMRGDSRDSRNDSRDMREMRGDSRPDLRDMRGDSRDMRGEARDMRSDFMRSKHDRDRKIPSLFDIKVSIPDDMKNSDGTTTPMPSPTQRSQDSTRSSGDRDNYNTDQERERQREKEREYEKLRLEKAERSKERKAKREKAKEHRKERRERREKEKEKKRERSKDAVSEKIGLTEKDCNKYSDILSPQSDDNVRRSVEEPQLPVVSQVDKSPEDKEKKTTEVNGMFPQHLPKKQQELFLRIQQQQREADSSQASANDDDEGDKAEEDNWYSSDEETAPTPTTTAPAPLLSFLSSSTSSVTPLLNILASATAAAKPVELTPAAPTPFIPTNLDLSNLSSVFEALSSLQKMNAVSTSAITTLAAETKTELAAPEPSAVKQEPPRMRDPRLRSDMEACRSSMEGPSDVDLRPQVVQSSGDVDLRSLPFKPVQHSAANEIDASLGSHLPIVWQLVPFDVVKADYSILQIQPMHGVVDPRLRRVVRPPTDELGLPRDPRQRPLDEPVRDPRARQPLLATPMIPPTPRYDEPPPTPRYDEDHRSQFYVMDSDMRHFPPPTPHLADEVYIHVPSRPVDPRQRAKALDDPRRLASFLSHPDDIDLRPHVAPRVPFVNFNK